MTTDFVPTLYLKQGCPFCFKLRLFLLEAGLLDRAQIEEFVPDTPGEAETRERLAPHFDTLSFPAARVGENDYMLESDAIIDWFAVRGKADKSQLPTFNAYVEGPLKRLLALFKENKELKSRAG